MDPYQHPEDKDRDGLQNAGFSTVQALDPADSPTELHYTQSPEDTRSYKLLNSLKMGKHF
jgi:hypothetical protein